jgi:hypothetical protein
MLIFNDLFPVLAKRLICQKRDGKTKFLHVLKQVGNVFFGLE